MWSLVRVSGSLALSEALIRSAEPIGGSGRLRLAAYGRFESFVAHHGFDSREIFVNKGTTPRVVNFVEVFAMRPESGVPWRADLWWFTKLVQSQSTNPGVSVRIRFDPRERVNNSMVE